MVDEINENLDEIYNRPYTSAAVYIGPRQISASTKLVSELIQSFIEHIVKGEALPVPHKAQAEDLENLQLKGMLAQVDDMIYELKSDEDEAPKIINLSALLRSGKINFSQLILDTYDGQENTKLADYIAQQGVEGAQIDYAGNKKDVKSNLQNAEGDAQELIDSIKNDKLVLNSARNKYKLNVLNKKPQKSLADLGRIIVLQKNINKINEKINRAKSLAQITDGAKIRDYLRQIVAHDEEFAGLRKAGYQPWEKLKAADKEDAIFIANISKADDSSEKPIEVVFNKRRYNDALARLKNYEDLINMDDASLVALRLYTGDAYRLTSTIFYNQEAGYRLWTPEQMSNNLLAACVLAHTTANHASFHAKVTRVDGSPVISKEATEARENKQLIEKLGPTSTSTIGPLADFLKHAKTATVSEFENVLGIKISPISVWKGEEEVLMPSGQLMVVKKVAKEISEESVEDDQKIIHKLTKIKHNATIQHAGGYDPRDSDKSSLDEGVLVHSSLKSALDNSPVRQAPLRLSKVAAESKASVQTLRKEHNLASKNIPGYMKSTFSSEQKQVKPTSDFTDRPDPIKPKPSRK